MAKPPNIYKMAMLPLRPKPACNVPLVLGNHFIKYHFFFRYKMAFYPDEG